MENNTPNTPSELLAMQLSNKQDSTETDCDLFADFLDEEVLPEFDPSPYQTVKAVEMLLRRLYSYHFNMLRDDDVEMGDWVKHLWEEDCNRLKVALDAVRLINPD